MLLRTQLTQVATCGMSNCPLHA